MRVIIIGQGVNALPESEIARALGLISKEPFDIDKMLDDGSLVLLEPMGGCTNYRAIINVLVEYGCRVLSPAYRGESLHWEVHNDNS